MGTVFSSNQTEVSDEISRTKSNDNLGKNAPKNNKNNINVTQIPKYVEIDLNSESERCNSNQDNPKACTLDSDSADEYFGENNNHLDFFLKYASEAEITPQGYAEFTVNKIGKKGWHDTSRESIELTDEQNLQLQELINNPTNLKKDFELLCQYLKPEQFNYVGW